MTASSTIQSAIVAGVLCLAPAAALGAPSILGNWQTPAGSTLAVYPCADAVCIRIVEVERSAPGTTDANNADPSLRSRPLCGLQIGSGFHPVADGQSAADGQIYDPKSGKTYHGAMQTTGADQLKLRGYVGVSLFGRTEVWTRSTASIPACP